VTVEDSDELFPAAEALASLPPIRNNRVAILADGGGHAAIAADVLTDHGVEIPELTTVDPQFGPVIMFGAGGILVELLRAVVFRVLPITRNAAKQMLSEFRSAPLLNGFRGRPPVDRDGLVDLLATVGELIESYPRIQEMDLNPVIAHEKGLTVFAFERHGHAFIGLLQDPDDLLQSQGVANA